MGLQERDRAPSGWKPLPRSRSRILPAPGEAGGKRIDGSHFRVHYMPSLEEDRHKLEQNNLQLHLAVESPEFGDFESSLRSHLWTDLAR